MTLVPGIPDKKLEVLLREAALAYYEPADIARMLQLDLSLVTRLLNTPAVQNRVAELQRGFVESGERFRLTAKQMASQILEQVAADALDGDNATAERLKAAELLVRWAGLAPKEGTAAVNVEINLGPALDDAYGRLERVRDAGSPGAPTIDLTLDARTPQD